MIAGKAGESIARIQKDSSAHVELQQQNDDSSLQERVVTVQGKHMQCLVLAIENDALPWFIFSQICAAVCILFYGFAEWKALFVRPTLS